MNDKIEVRVSAPQSGYVRVGREVLSREDIRSLAEKAVQAQRKEANGEKN